MRTHLVRAVVLVLTLPLVPFAALLGIAPAAVAAAPVTVLVAYNGVGGASLGSSTADTLVPSATGGVATSYDFGYRIEPVPGQRLVPGRVDIAKGQTGVPQVRMDQFQCDATRSGFQGGYLDVLDAVYDGSGTLTSFAANASMDCGTSVGTIQVRYSSTVPYVDLSAPVVQGSAYPGTNAAVTTTFTNTGTMAVTPGQTVLRGVYGGLDPAEPGSVVTDDACAGTTLQPTESCTVTVNSPPNGAYAFLSVPQLDGLAQRRATPAAGASVRVSSIAPPASVTKARAVGAVDGIHVSWTVADPYRGGDFQVERRTGTGPWTVVAAHRYQLFSFADTTAPAGQASTYRITPTSDAGPYASGALTTGPATPVTGWTAPAGATTFGSVDGYAPATGSGVLVEGDTVRIGGALKGRPTMLLGMRGGWALGTWQLGQEFGQVIAGWTQDPDAGVWGVATGTLQVTRLVLRPDGTPAELAAVFTGTRRMPDGTSVPTSAAVVVGTTGASMPGYLVAEVDPDLPVWARLDTGGFLMLQTANNMDFTVPVRLRNVGGAPVTSTGRGAVSVNVTPVQESAWTPGGSCQGVSIPGGSSCTTSARYVSDSGYPWAQAWWTYGNRTARVSFWSTWESPWPSLDITAPALVEHDAEVQTTVSDPNGQEVPLHCRLDDGPFVGCGSTWQLTGLADGVHRVSVYGYTADGRMSHWDHATITADSAPPTASLVRPSAEPTVVLGTTSPVSWSSSDHASGVRSSQLRLQTATYRSGYSALATPAWAQAAQAAGTQNLTVGAGQEQCWSVRAVDRSDRWSAWSSERCLIAPVDDRSLSARRFSRVGSASAFNRTVSVAKRRGASLTLSQAVGRQVGLVVSTCATCGTVNVTLGGVRIGTVSTRGATRSKVVVWLPRFAATRAGSLSLVTTSKRPVTVDGVLVRHR